MSKLRYRLIFAVVSITLLVMSGLGWTIAQLYENFYLHNLTDRLEKEANLAAFMFAEQGINTENTARLTTELAEHLSVRVTIILQDGTVVGESDANAEQMDKHNLRPEIEAIVSGQIKETIRYSETLNEQMLYYAVPIPNDLGYVRLGLPMTALAEMNKRIWGILIVSFVIAFLIIVFITVRIARQMVGPIEDVTAVANELAKGNYRARTSEGRKDEIGQLTRSMNMLAYQLKKMTNNYEVQQEQMATLIENMGSSLLLLNTRGEILLMNKAFKQIFGERSNEWTNLLYYEVIKEKEMIKFIQKVFMTEEKQRAQVRFTIQEHERDFEFYGAPIFNKMGKLTGIVIVLHDITELKRLEQVRQDFVANVSHELKTPVTSIKGFAETLLDGAMESEELREKFLNIIHKESDRLQSLIQDLLELSRIEQQYISLSLSFVNVTDLLHEVIDLLHEKINDKQITIHLQTVGDPTIEGDAARLKQVMINVIMNAVKYTGDGGSVKVMFVGKEDDVEITIADNGVGISEEELPRIFERFYRVDRARTRQTGGTGLGLAIVKHLVEAHDGRIQVQSQVGVGTTFTIRLRRKHYVND